MVRHANSPHPNASGRGLFTCSMVSLILKSGKRQHIHAATGLKMSPRTHYEIYETYDKPLEQEKGASGTGPVNKKG